MRELNAHLKSGNLKKIYLFYGPERYLIRAYKERLVKAVVGPDASAENVSVFEGEKVSPENIKEAARTVSFFGGERLIILWNTGLMNVDWDTTTLFIQTEKAPDKRSKLYKEIAAAGYEAVFNTPPEHELRDWLVKVFSSKGVEISSGTANAMLRHTLGPAIGGQSGKDEPMGGVMDFLYMEAMKLCACKGYAGAADTRDIEALCTRHIEGKVFAMVKEMGTKNMAAFTSLNNLLEMKEQPLMLLSMIARQFRFILISKGLKNAGAAPAEIAKRAGLRDFMVRDFLAQGANFTESALVKMMLEIEEAESAIKGGRQDGRMALEMLVARACVNR